MKWLLLSLVAFAALAATRASPAAAQEYVNECWGLPPLEYTECMITAVEYEDVEELTVEHFNELGQFLYSEVSYRTIRIVMTNIERYLCINPVECHWAGIFSRECFQRYIWMPLYC